MSNRFDIAHTALHCRKYHEDISTYASLIIHKKKYNGNDKILNIFKILGFHESNLFLFFFMFCIRAAPAMFKTEVEHGAMSTLLLRLELQYSVCPSVHPSTYKSLNLKKFLSVFLDIACLTLFLLERHTTPLVTHGHIPH